MTITKAQYDSLSPMAKQASETFLRSAFASRPMAVSEGVLRLDMGEVWLSSHVDTGRYYANWVLQNSTKAFRRRGGKTILSADLRYRRRRNALAQYERGERSLRALSGRFLEKALSVILRTQAYLDYLVQDALIKGWADKYGFNSNPVVNTGAIQRVSVTPESQPSSDADVSAVQSIAEETGGQVVAPSRVRAYLSDEQRRRLRAAHQAQLDANKEKIKARKEAEAKAKAEMALKARQAAMDTDNRFVMLELDSQPCAQSEAKEESSTDDRFAFLEL